MTQGNHANSRTSFGIIETKRNVLCSGFVARLISLGIPGVDFMRLRSVVDFDSDSDMADSIGGG